METTETFGSRITEYAFPQEPGVLYVAEIGNRTGSVVSLWGPFRTVMAAATEARAAAVAYGATFNFSVVNARRIMEVK